MDTQETSPFFQVLDDAWADHYFKGYRAAIDRLESAIRSPGVLTADEVEHATSMVRMLERAEDLAYRPVREEHFTAVYPLHLHVETHRKAARMSEAIASAWRCVQFSSAGTASFNGALSLLADVAAAAGKTAVARRAAEMWLSHRDLIDAAKECDNTPVSSSDPSPEKDWSDDPPFPMMEPPYEAALICIPTDGAACWVRVLEIAEQRFAGLGNYPRLLKRVQDALSQHREQTAIPAQADSRAAKTRVDLPSPHGKPGEPHPEGNARTHGGTGMATLLTQPRMAGVDQQLRSRFRRHCLLHVAAMLLAVSLAGCSPHWSLSVNNTSEAPVEVFIIEQVGDRWFPKRRAGVVPAHSVRVFRAALAWKLTECVVEIREQSGHLLEEIRKPGRVIDAAVRDGTWSISVPPK